MAPVVALSAALGIALQYAVVLAHADGIAAAAQATLRFCSYFTIQSNLLVALACALPLWGRPRRLARFFGTPRVRGGIALYITVTAGVYIALLSHLWTPHGGAWLANVLLHYWVPPLYVALWLITAWAPNERLRWSDALRWLAFPLAYLAWTILRGAWQHEYPYPFVDVATLGALGVLRNALGLLVLFVVLGLLLIGLHKLVERRRSQT